MENLNILILIQALNFTTRKIFIIQMYPCSKTHTRTCTYIDIYVHTHVLIYTHTHIYTYTYKMVNILYKCFWIMLLLSHNTQTFFKS